MIVTKNLIIQHLYGIRSLRQTIEEIKVNMAYRWFLHYNIDTRFYICKHRYSFATRFPSEVFEEIFSYILERAVERGLVDAKAIFIDAIHIKANANRKKKR